MARKQYLLGVSPSEIERQDGWNEDNDRAQFSAADARACLEAVKPDVPHLTPFRRQVLDAFLRHVKPKLRQRWSPDFGQLAKVAPTIRG